MKHTSIGETRVLLQEIDGSEVFRDRKLVAACGELSLVALRTQSPQ